MCLMTLQVPGQELVRLETTGIEVVSDAGERSGRAIIDRVLELRQALPNEFSAGLKVLVLSRDQRFKRVRPHEQVSGFFLRGGGENLIVLSDPAEWRVLRHELVHFALDHSAVSLPLWLEEGLAEYYSTLEFQRNRLVAGLPIPEHQAWLEKNGVLELAKLLAVAGNPGPEVYATGWALVHMLKLSPDYQAHYGEFWQRLQKGERAREILPVVFGRSLDQMAGDLSAYVSRRSMPTEPIAMVERSVAPARVETLRLTKDEFDDHYVALVRAMGKLDEAYRLAGESASRRGPGAQAVARALRATAENRPEAAREAWEQALSAGVQRADVYFEYAGTLRAVAAPDSDIAAALRRTVELNPRFVQAHLWLAALEGRLGRWAEAERHLTLASAQAPRRYEIWYELAFVRRALGQREPARDAVAKALAVAASELDREKALALRDSLTEPAGGAPKAPVTMAKGWEMPTGDKQAEGEWLELVCDQPAVLKLQTAAGAAEWIIRDPGRVTLRNTGSQSYEFRCGKQDPVRRVRLGYESVTREVRVLEFLP